MSCFQAHTRPSVLEGLEAALAACGLPLHFVPSFLDASGLTRVADLPFVTCEELIECLRGIGVKPMKSAATARQLAAYAIASRAPPPHHDGLGTASAHPEPPSPAPAPLSTAPGAPPPPRLATAAAAAVAPSDPCLVPDGLDEAERSTPHSGALAPTPNNHLDGASSVTSGIGSDAMIEKTGALSPDPPLSSPVKEVYSRCTASASPQCAAVEDDVDLQIALHLQAEYDQEIVSESASSEPLPREDVVHSPTDSLPPGSYRGRAYGSGYRPGSDPWTPSVTIDESGRPPPPYVPGPGLVRFGAFARRAAHLLPLSPPDRVDAVGHFAAELASAARRCCKSCPALLDVLNGLVPLPGRGVHSLFTSGWRDGSIASDSYGTYAVCYDLSNSSVPSELQDGFYTFEPDATSTDADGWFAFPLDRGARQQIRWLDLEAGCLLRQQRSVSVPKGGHRRGPAGRFSAEFVDSSRLMLGLRLFMELTLSCALLAPKAREDPSLLSSSELALRAEEEAVFRGVRANARALAVNVARARADACATVRARAAAAEAAEVSDASSEPDRHWLDQDW